MTTTQSTANSSSKDSQDHIHPKVTQFLQLLGQANSVIADSPALSNWETSEANGSPENEVVRFAWVDDDGLRFSCVLTEGGIAAGQWKGDSFFCEDSEGEPCQISIYRHVALTPPACNKCGSHLEGDYCADQTCVYNDWPQVVTKEDIKVFDTDEIEEKYGVKKRQAINEE